MRPPRIPKKRTIDERGLTSMERKVGATVQMRDGLYRVVKLQNGVAHLELITQKVGAA
jgi:hypothetical protein